MTATPPDRRIAAARRPLRLSGREPAGPRRQPPTAGADGDDMAHNTPRRGAAIALALAVAAAGCSGPDPEPAAPEPAAETTAPPAPAPETSGPGRCADTALRLETAAEFRALAEAIETADGPPSGDDYRAARAARLSATFWDDHCDGAAPVEGAWAAEDETRFDRIRAARRAAEAQAAERAAGVVTDEDIAEAETGADLPPAGPRPPVIEQAPGSGPDAPGGTAPAEPAPEPAPTTAEPPAPTTAVPEPPDAIDFADKAPDIDPGQDGFRVQAGTVELGAPVRLAEYAELFCPDWDVTVGGFTGCGDYGTPGDFLHANRLVLTGACHHPPVRLGVGDSYTWTSPTVVFDEPLEGGHLDVRAVRSGQILGFSDPILRPPYDWPSVAEWTFVKPQVAESLILHYSMADGTTETWPLRELWIGQPSEPWVVTGGPGNRGLAEDGNLAWGMLAAAPLTLGYPHPDDRQSC